jgi:hypothetical protein
MAADATVFPFAPISLDDRPRIERILASDPQPLSDFGFASLVIWAPVHVHRVAIESDTLLVTTEQCALQDPNILQPVGAFPESLQDRILDWGRASSGEFRICSVGEAFLERYPTFVEHFEVSSRRDNANYIYRTADLATLRGGTYAKQRNRISRLIADVNWTVEPLDTGHLDECRLVADDIATKRSPEGCVTLEEENLALEEALELFGPLGLEGVLLRLDGRPTAFAIYERLNATTAVVQFERALRSRKGAYQLINRETARVLVDQGFELVNREEDLGDPGLRDAKLSYGPLRLEMKHTLTLRR